MSPLDLATAYGGLANNGIRYNNYIVDKVIDIDGNELSVTALADRTPKKISSTSQASYYFLNSTLQKVIAPGGTAYRSANTYGFKSPSYSAKTGTTSEHRDNWFVAYNDEIVTVAWIGSDRNDVLPNNVTGSGLPRNHTCVNTTPLTVGGNIDLSTQCNIDHIRSGTRRNNSSDMNNIIEEEEDYYYYTPLDENNDYTNEKPNGGQNNIYTLPEEVIYDPTQNNIYTLPEEVIYDPTVGNIRS